MMRVRITIEGRIAQEVELDRELVVGRSPKADVTVDDHEVSSRHLRIRPDGETAVVVDLGSTNGTMLDGARRLEPNEPVKLERGSMLTLGTSLLEVIEAAHKPDSQLHDEVEKTVAVQGAAMQGALVAIARFKAAKPRLVLAAQHDRRVEPLDEMEVLIGRDAGRCQIVIDHASVSAEHAEIRFDAGEFVIEDKGSSNGTFVQGERISGPTRLGAQTAVTIGTVECLFVRTEPVQPDERSRQSETLIAHLVTLGRATAQQGRDVLASHRETGRSLGELLVQGGILSPKVWTDVYAQRETISTLGPVAAGRRSSAWPWIVMVVVVLAVAAAAAWRLLSP